LQHPYAARDARYVYWLGGGDEPPQDVTTVPWASSLYCDGERIYFGGYRDGSGGAGGGDEGLSVVSD
jgi:hypothetical protein